MLKPPELSPLTASLLADIAAQAGLPDGVLNVVQGTRAGGGRRARRAPGRRPHLIHRLGGDREAIAAAAAANLTPLSLELGGKSPFIVFADADLDLAVDNAVEQYDNAGQVCLSGTRLLVESSIRDEFVRGSWPGRRRCARVTRAMSRPTSAPTSAAQLERVDGFVQRARAAGATVLGGGRQRALGGLYYQPTLITDVAAGQRDLHREVFGPVLVLHTFDTEARR